MLKYLDVMTGKLVETTKEPEKEEALSINAINSDELVPMEE